MYFFFQLIVKLGNYRNYILFIGSPTPMTYLFDTEFMLFRIVKDSGCAVLF